MAEYIILNDGNAEDETALGAIDIFASLEEAVFECEHWVSEPCMHFYDVHGERLIAIDHGDWMNFHFERTGTFFEGFADLIRREADRNGINMPDTGFSAEYAFRILYERERKFSPR